MKSIPRLLSMILLFFHFSLATTYFTTFINGTPADTAVQGGQMAWEFDVSQSGGSALISIYLDEDASADISGPDVLLVQFGQTDGDTEGEGGPADSSDVPDGVVYSQMGIFGFAPGSYLFKVHDNQDESEVIHSFVIRPLPEVNVWISGTLSKEEVSAPAGELENIMIEATPMDFEGEMWSGLTDENGDYIINLPDNAVGRKWQVSLMFDTQVSGWLSEPEEYEDVSINSGENEPFNFFLKKPGAYVYGAVLDENRQVVAVRDWGNLRNELMGDGSGFEIIDGHFVASAFFEGADTVDVPFGMDIWGENLLPDYLIPNCWSDPYYRFSLSLGDSIEKNFYVQSTDTTIVAVITQDGQTLQSGVYLLRAQNDTLGHTRAENGAGGVANLHVLHSHPFSVSLISYDEDYPLPEGYILEGDNWIEAWPGDTVYFNLIPASGSISGRISFRGNSGDFFDPDEANMQAYSDDGKYYASKIEPDSMTYNIAVSSGTYTVQFNSYNRDFLSLPARYENVQVADQHVDTLDFELKYAFATLKVRLKSAPWYWDWWHITTEGADPARYETGAEAGADTVYHFRVCEGNWMIYPPHYGEDYEVYPSDTTVSVVSGQDHYEVEFVCTEATGIREQERIPKNFFVKQNYPNPFNPQTTIEFGLPRAMEVSVEIYDIRGRKVSDLICGPLQAGVHKVRWNGEGYASGVYIYRVHSGKNRVTKRLLLLK